MSAAKEGSIRTGIHFPFPSLLLDRYDEVMRFRRPAKIVAILFFLLPILALVAPVASDHPVLSAYRIYHPFMCHSANELA